MVKLAASSEEPLFPSATLATFRGEADPLVLCFEGVNGGDGGGNPSPTISVSSEKNENSPISSAICIASIDDFIL